MITPRVACLSSAIAVLVLSSAMVKGAEHALPDIDQAFFAKVSQDGMYEVELGTLAETKGSTQHIRDSGNA